MRENLRIRRWPFDMDRFACVHLDDANYAAVRCKRNSDGRSSITRRAHESQVRDSGIPYAILVFARQSKEIVLSIEGGSTFLPFQAKGVTRRGVRKVYLLLPWKSLFRGE